MGDLTPERIAELRARLEQLGWIGKYTGGLELLDAAEENARLKAALQKLTPGELQWLARLASTQTNLRPRFYKDDRSDEEAFARKIAKKCERLARALIAEVDASNKREKA